MHGDVNGRNPADDVTVVISIEPPVLVIIPEMSDEFAIRKRGAVIWRSGHTVHYFGAGGHRRRIDHLR
jgi:hypothetical protein